MLLATGLAFLLVCVLLALAAAARDARRLGEAALVAAAAVFLCAHWLYSASAQFAVFGVGLFTLGLLGTWWGEERRRAADALRRDDGEREGEARDERPHGGVAAPRGAGLGGTPAAWWSGLLVIAAATALKVVGLGEWPAHLNAYSAETGWWGILTLDGVWPRDLWRGVDYDLVNGGRSPLHLPLTWLTVRLSGGTVYALRLAEVMASTVLLLVFWGWLRHRLEGPWSVASLAAFAFSPWHLAQSRMGTFFSGSAAIAVALLWAADSLDRLERRAPGEQISAPRRVAHWASLGILAGLIGYAYAPLKVLYLFFAAVWARLSWASWRRRQAGWWRGPAAALLPFALILAVQLGMPPRFDEMFRRDFGPLATDTSIWHKTTEGVVTEERQPPRVATANAWRNLVVWWQSTWAEERILVWYAPALSVAVPAAALMLFRSSTWVPAFYFLVGVIPPLMIFPVQRRTLVLWPLVYVAGVLAGRELAALCARLVDRTWWRWAARSAVAVFALIATVRGLEVYATTNSIVGLGTYFGPDHRLEMLLEAERLLPSCRVYFVNASFEEKMVALVRLFEPSRRAGGDERVGFVDFSPGDGLPPLRRDQPLCFFLLARDRPADVAAPEAVMQDLGRTLPGSMLMRRWAGDGSDTLQYVVVTAAASPPATVVELETEVGDGGPE